MRDEHAQVFGVRTSRLPLAIVLLLAAGGLEAQQDTGRTTLPDIVVTATRWPTSREAVAARVTVLDGAALRAQGFTQLADALRQVPGLDVVQTGSFGGQTSVFVRGGESDYVQVLLDGVPLNQPGGAVDFADLSLENVERVEIVRGPTSVLYGSDAVSGVIQIFTRRGRGPMQAEAAARAGTFGTVEAEASVLGGGPAVGYSLTARRFTTDGILPFNNDYRNASVSGRLHAAPDERTEVDLSVRYRDTRFHFPTDGAGNLVDRNAFRLGTMTALGVEIGRRFSERVEGRLHVRSNVVNDGLDDRPDDPADTVGFFGARSQVDLRRQGVDGRVLVALPAVGHLTLGAAAERQQERSLRQDFSQFGTFVGGTDSAVSRFNHAWYAQLLVDRGPVALNAGARVDVNQEFGTFPTVRGGVTYRAPTGTRLYASAGTAFKEPTFFENFGGASAAGNPDLEPERSFSLDGGVEQTLLGGRFVVAVTGFRQRFRDLIDFTFAPANPGDPNFFNIAAASADGVELEVHAEPAVGLVLSGGYTYLRTEVTDSGFDGGAGSAFGAGRRLLRRPEVRARLEARYRAFGRATLGAAVRHVSSRPDLDFSTFPFARATLPAYTLLDLSAAVTVLRARSVRPGLILTGRVENVFDETYQQAFGFPARGRMVLVGGRVGM